ncbi:DUF6477 family protein [Paracoccus albus]|nr:DUF6477 family protein [Paracoccus albus]WBU61557.1 DUF6477 family protein [Paracoccus albus]
MNDPKIFTFPQPQQRLKRPAPLIRAARSGQSGWNPSRDLARLIGRDELPSPHIVSRLLHSAEQACEDARRAGRADYDVHRHIMLLIALLAELTAVQGSARAQQSRGAR